MDKIKAFFTFLEGKKTYIAGLLLLGYGFLQNNMEAILLALAIMGIRKGITEEVSKIQ